MGALGRRRSGRGEESEWESEGQVGRGARGGAASAPLSSPGPVAARGGELVRRRQRARSDEQWGAWGGGDRGGEVAAGPPGPTGCEGMGRSPGGLSGLVLVFLFLLLFIFFSVLNHFKLFRHFIKMCLLHHNYLCNIRQPPNNFVLIFENFYCYH